MVGTDPAISNDMVLSLPPPTPLPIFIPDTLDLTCNSQGPLTHSTAKWKKPHCKSIFFPIFFNPLSKKYGFGARIYILPHLYGTQHRAGPQLQLTRVARGTCKSQSPHDGRYFHLCDAAGGVGDVALREK